MTDSKDAEEVGKRMKGVLTTNSYGFMLEFDDPMFAEGLKLIDKSKPVLDLGVAFGYSTKRLLDQGCTVVTNDLDEQMLKKLCDDIPKEQRNRLIIAAGNINDLDFDENSFGSIISLRMLHFLKGVELRDAFDKMYKWLAPGGILVITAVDSCCCFKQEYGVKFKNLGNIEWPGESNFVRNESMIDRITPDFIHFLSVNILVREASKVGFYIYKGNLLQIYIVI